MSGFEESSDEEPLASFAVDGKRYSIVKAKGYKCPRCWRFTSEAEDALCARCSEVVA